MEHKTSLQTRDIQNFVKYFISNQIAIYLALNIQEMKNKYDAQLVCNDNLYFRV